MEGLSPKCPRSAVEVEGGAGHEEVVSALDRRAPIVVVTAQHLQPVRTFLVLRRRHVRDAHGRRHDPHIALRSSL